MKQNESAINILNDLLQINNDRIQGYEKAIEDTKSLDADYRSLFNQMIDESKLYKQELISEITGLGGNPDVQETTNSGKIYRIWMDVKTTFAGNSDKSALELCEFGEDAAQKAYGKALDPSENLPSSTQQLLRSQMAELKKSHDIIKNERDLQKAKS